MKKPVKNVSDPEWKKADLLAFQRTILAQERTLMAWVRTSLSMISFGFTIFKLFSELKNVNELLQSGGEGSGNFGITLIGLGTFLLIAASIQHQMILKDLHVHGVTKRISLPFIAAIAISLLGLTMLFGILYNIGPLN